MKKFLAVLFSMVLLAAQPVFSAGARGALVNGVTLSGSTTAVTSNSLNVNDAKKIGFYVSYNETEVGGVSGAFTVETSYDGTNWSAASFYDFAGGATLQTSEAFTADSLAYFCWMVADAPFRLVRVKMTGTGVDADDTIVTTINYVVLN